MSSFNLLKNIINHFDKLKIIIVQELGIAIYLVSTIEEWDLISLMSVITALFGYLNIISVIILFATLSLMVSGILQVLCEQVRTHRKWEGSRANAKRRLDEWINQYDLVCQLVDQLNHFFGLMLLVFFVKLFVIFITNSFMIMIEIQKQRNWLYMYMKLFSSSFCQIVILTSVCHHIRIQVNIQFCDKVWWNRIKGSSNTGVSSNGRVT